MRSVLTWTAVAIVGLAIAWAVLHVVITPVNPAQEPPEKHYAAPCWACHLVTSAAQVTDPNAEQ